MSQFAIVNSKFKKIFKKKNFLSQLNLPRYEEYKRIKHKIDNDYLKCSLNDENMSFVYTFAKILGIRDLFIKCMQSFKGLPHEFEILRKKYYIY